MRNNPSTRAAFLDRLYKFEEAAIEKSWKGSKDPREHEIIEEIYKLRREALLAFLGINEHDTTTQRP